MPPSDPTPPAPGGAPGGPPQTPASAGAGANERPPSNAAPQGAGANERPPSKAAPQAALAAAVALAVLLFLLRGVLAPFLAGALLAWLLVPARRALERRLRLPRAAAALACVLLTLALAAGALLLLAPVLLAEASRLSALLQDRRADLEPLLRGGRLGPLLDAAGERALGAAGAVASGAGRAAAVGAGWLGSALSGVAFALLAPVAALLALRDWESLQAAALARMPERLRAPAVEFGRDAERILFAWARSVAVVVVALSAVYAVGLALIGVPHALFVGVFAGVLSAVPFLGAAVGILLAGGLALLEHGLSWQPAAVVALFLAAQALESNVLTPRLVGDALGIHPLAALFALAAGGSLFGLAGALLALPALAALEALLARLPGGGARGGA